MNRESFFCLECFFFFFPTGTGRIISSDDDAGTAGGCTNSIASSFLGKAFRARPFACCVVYTLSLFIAHGPLFRCFLPPSLLLYFTVPNCPPVPLPLHVQCAIADGDGFEGQMIRVVSQLSKGKKRRKKKGARARPRPRGEGWGLYSNGF